MKLLNVKLERKNLSKCLFQKLKENFAGTDCKSQVDNLNFVKIFVLALFHKQKQNKLKFF